MALITFVGFVLRMYHAAHLWLWGDEAWGLYLIRRGFGQLIPETALDQHPPLYYQLIYLWSQFAGHSELALRLFSIFLGVLTIPLAYKVGMRLSGRTVGIVAALLTAIAPFSVYYGQEARMYSLVIALSLVSTYLLLGLMQRDPHPPAPLSRSVGEGGRGVRAEWVAYGLVTLLGLLTLYTYAFFVAAQGLALLLTRRSRPRLRTWLAIQSIVALVLAPYVLLVIQPTIEHLNSQSQSSEVKPLGQLLGETWAGLAAGVTLAPPTAGVLALGVGVIAAVGLLAKVIRPRSQFEQVIYLVTALVVPLLLFYPLHLRLPWFQPRVFAFIAPAVYLLVAWGLVALWQWRRGAAGLALAYLGLAWGWGLCDYYVNFSRYDGYEDYRPMMDYFAARAQPGDIVLHHARWEVGYFEAYYHGPPLDFEYILDIHTTRLGTAAGLQAAFQPVALTPGDVSRLLAEQRPRQVWVMWRDVVRQPGGTRLEDRIEDGVSQLGFKADETWFGHVRVTRYVLPPSVTTGLTPVETVLEGGIRLESYSLVPPDSMVRPGASLYLTLHWRAEGPAATSYTAFTHVIGTTINPKDGTPVWAGHDLIPANGERPTTTWQAGEEIRDPHILTLEPNTPPGSYVLEAGLYNPATGQRLHVLRADGSEGEDHIALMTLTVR